jgi:hypothetical protein
VKDRQVICTRCGEVMDLRLGKERVYRSVEGGEDGRKG